MKTDKQNTILKRKLDFENVIQQYRKIRGVIHYYIWETHPADLKSSIRSHRQVAIKSMQTLVDEWEAEVQQRMKHLNKTDDYFFKMTFQPKILENETEKPKKIDVSAFVELYAYAFFSPPYGLEKNAETSYYNLNKELLACKLPNVLELEVHLENQALKAIDLEIYQWTDTCSNFFDAGAEWWGTHFYTVYVPSLNHYVCVLASTTD